MKTPIKELIDSVGNMTQGLDADELYDYFMEKATRMLEKEKDVIEDIIDIIDSENSGQSAEQRLDSIKEYLLTFNTKEK